MDQPVTHIGDVIRRRVLTRHKLTISKAALILGVQRHTLSRLLHGRATLSPKMALRLELTFGLSLNYTLQLQAQYQEEAMRALAPAYQAEHQIKRYGPAFPAGS